jgi:branched-chain amino acid transport system substrate-binding protein
VLTRIDPVSEHLRSIPVGGAPTAVTVGAAGVLVADASGSGGINADSCSSVSSAPGVRPQLVVVADLDMYDGGYTPPMAKTIRYEFSRHHFAAGRYHLGLQICNDSTPQSVIADPTLCTANARVYARVKRVIGVIGPNQSGCAFDEMPILDRSGPLAMVGTGNNPGLTLTPRGGQFVPSRVRDFVRVSSRYDQWGVAAALLAKRLRLHRVYLRLGDAKDFYGSYMAPAFARKARELGIQVIGPASPTRGFKRLGERLAAQGVDGVFDADVNGDPEFVADMRAALGPSAALIGPDTFLPLGPPFAVPRAELGMYVIGGDFTNPARQLPAAGRSVVAAIARNQPAGWSDAWVPYAAQETDVLLSAIAHSNGTRASVTKQLFHYRAKNGVLGSFAITPNGDPSRSIVLAYRLIHESPGTRPVAVFRVPASPHQPTN